VKNFSIRFLLFIIAAELLASFAVWHGTPTDWKAQPLSFWHFEAVRIRYWSGFGLAFAALWVIGWLSLRRLSATVLPVLLALLCAISTEMMTSIYFWRSLPPNQASYLGWYDSRQYFGEHLVSWIVVLAISGLCLWYWNRRRAPQPDTHTTAESSGTTP
jgi:hypothetical protein